MRALLEETYGPRIGIRVPAPAAEQPRPGRSYPTHGGPCGSGPAPADEARAALAAHRRVRTPLPARPGGARTSARPRGGRTAAGRDRTGGVPPPTASRTPSTRRRAGPGHRPGGHRRVGAGAPRTLQYAFARHAATTPLACLRRVRLAQVHAELTAAAPADGGVMVTEVAARWGISHAGRFAAACRNAYGASPSQTLRSPSTADPGGRACPDG
ncbi:helix-turn-helix domain-containing protein [Streptomyces sp. NPDC059650]|uniref:helix-turn-helix domain-containing protein n=1 Tax=Streptomyces sp. NPDC059650 TaxID=3346896 RepID=UPI0036C521FE